MYEIYERLRNARNLNDYEVSKMSGVPRSIFTDWKNGRCSPALRTIIKLADFFNVSVDFLIGREKKG